MEPFGTSRICGEGREHHVFYLPSDAGLNDTTYVNALCKTEKHRKNVVVGIIPSFPRPLSTLDFITLTS